MTSQTLIRQAFTRDWKTVSQGSCDCWLVKGDFDHFKRTNDLYGSLITDYVLDWTLEEIESQLQMYQNRWGCDPLLLNVFGDDLTIYIPPSALAAQEIEHMLHSIRGAVHESFCERYLVGALPLPEDYFDDLSTGMLEILRFELEQIDAVLDFSRRQRGYLLLLPHAGESYPNHYLEKVMRSIRRVTGKALPPYELYRDWVCSPDDQSCMSFNQGYLLAPMVSFAACSARTVLAGCAPGYDTLSFACQAAMKQCKQQRLGVFFPRCRDGAQDPPLLAPLTLPAPPAPTSPLRWSSERYMRDRLYFKRLERPVVFQFNPVYSLGAPLPTDAGWADKYRGNGHGMGLKGINEFFGQQTADHLIRQLMGIISAGVQGVLAGKGIPADRVWAAQFVDRFTVCCEGPILQEEEIAGLVRDLAQQFNAASPEIKISYLRTSLIQTDEVVFGFRLFQQLALTGLSTLPAVISAGDPPVELRRNSTPALEQGRAAQERACFASAQFLAVRLGL